MTRVANLPIVLVDCGRTRDMTGLGQVACQYARALNNSASEDFAFRFLVDPRFAGMRRQVDKRLCLMPRFSPTGTLMRAFNKEWWRRRVYNGTGHAVRHILEPNCYQIPVRDRAPFVLTIHDVFMLDDTKKREKWMLRLRQMASRANVVGFISEYARRTASELVDFGGAEQHIIYNGVNKPQNPNKPEWFERIPENGNRPFLFSVGSVVKRKNYLTMPAVMRQLPKVNLIVAGNKNTNYAAEVQESARREGVADRLLMPGEVSESEKAWLFQNCAGFVFPSLAEGFGMPIVEALHFGKPVFCFANTALTEVGGEHVFYWRDDSPQTMSELIKQTLAVEQPHNESSRARMAWAEKFSWRNNVSAYLDIYRRLIK